MKRRLNILCLIVILVLSYSIIEAGYYFSVGITAGVEAGLNEHITKKQQEKMMNIKYIHLMPEELSLSSTDGLFQDSVYNTKNGQYVPMSYSGLVASIGTRSNVWSIVADKLLTFVHLITSIWAIVLFIRLIISINKSEIFSWKNVRRLRRLGMVLVVCFVSMLLTAYLTFYEVNEVFAIKGYHLSFSDMISITTLVLGISTLIVAEVFAIGLKMKEDQDLTI